MADSNLVHMYYSNDNWDVDRLAIYLENHPFLFAGIYLIKETDTELPPYKIIIDRIADLIPFYALDEGASWTNMISHLINTYNVYCIQAERHGINDRDGMACSIKLDCDVDLEEFK